MARNNTGAKLAGDMEFRVVGLEERGVKLEKRLRRDAKKAKRRTRNYTDEERAAIRARILAGQQAAAKESRTRDNSGEASALCIMGDITSGVL